MYSIMFRRIQLAVCNGRFATINSASEFSITQNSLLAAVRLLSSSANTKKRSVTVETDELIAKRRSFTLSYLVNTCGLSPDSAEIVSMSVALKTQENPDASLSILRDYGFTDTQIAKLIRKLPQILLAKKKTFLPKLEFLRSIGLPNSDIGRLVSWNPKLLSRSLEKFIIPCYNELKSVLIDDVKVCRVVRHTSMIILEDIPKNLANNVTFLSGLGVPQSMITTLLMIHPGLVCSNTDKLRRQVEKTLAMGFDPSKWTFLCALQVICLMTDKTWEHKMEVYRRWGLSDDSILLAFKRYPRFMTLSEKKIMDSMDFLVNKMGWQLEEVIVSPVVLCYSLDKRIVPRCLVARYLLMRGLVKEKIPLASLMVLSEKRFLNLYVTKYREEVPELLSIFQGKTSVPESCFGFKERSAIKNV